MINDKIMWFHVLRSPLAASSIAIDDVWITGGVVITTNHFVPGGFILLICKSTDSRLSALVPYSESSFAGIVNMVFS